MVKVVVIVCVSKEKYAGGGNRMSGASWKYAWGRESEVRVEGKK